MSCAFSNHRDQQGGCIRRNFSNLARRVTSLQIYLSTLDICHMASAPVWLASSHVLLLVSERYGSTSQFNMNSFAQVYATMFVRPDWNITK